jgi:hypothetical protein
MKTKTGIASFEGGLSSDMDFALIPSKSTPGDRKTGQPRIPSKEWMALGAKQKAATH